ncbi:MAG TPA: hypothetical protein VFN44_07845 [Solirubrobacteraceae bacterium]|nr:hypothetical protein [Solirubrobacteraceae bacterium]
MRIRGVVAASCAALAVAAAPVAAHVGQQTGTVEWVDPESPEAQGDARNMVAVGSNSIGGRGFNADVWVHEQYAYVGSWGFSDYASGSKQRFCPSPDKAGVAVLDTRDPSKSRVVSKLQNPPGTSVEDVVVYTAPYGPRAGRDIAVAGIQVCGGDRTDTGFFRGLQVFDVTDPAKPVELGLLSTGCCARGLHELEVQHRADLRRSFVYASVPTSEYPDASSPSGRRDHQGKGDFRLIDVTNPTLPWEVSNWGVHRNLGGPPAPGLGCDPDPEYGHSPEPRADGKVAWMAYWDSGFIALDLADPANPVYKGRTSYPADADGDGHSSNYDEGRKLLFAADEDFGKSCGSATEKGFGFLRVYDYSSLGAPVQIGSYKTPNASGSKDVNAGDYTIHNPLLSGTDLYVSWYTDGIRVLDTKDPRNVREVAYFVPPSVNNPIQPSQRGTLTNATQVWGVAYDEARKLVYASDMNSGLWILKRTK